MGTKTRGSRPHSVIVSLAVVLVTGCSAAPSAAPSASPPVAPTVGSTAHSPTAAPAPSPTELRAAIAWQRVGFFESTTSLGGIAASPAGYVVLDLGRTVWFSPDGRTWTKSILPFTSSTSHGRELGAEANAIIGGPDGFVAVGGYDHTPCGNGSAAGGPPPCDVKPISWTSTDGITWTSSLPGPLPANGSGLPKYSEMVMIWAAGDGWDAAIEARDSVMYHGNTLLHSKDGLAWTQLASPPLPEGAESGDDIQGHGGAGTPTGERVVWQYREHVAGFDTTLSATQDGTSWTRVPGFDGANAIVRLALAPQGVDGGPWLLIGERDVAGSNGVAVWRSDDMVTWHSELATASGAPLTEITALNWSAGGFIALGSQAGQLHPDPPTTWRSDDGLTWTSVDDPLPKADDRPVFMAFGPAGLVGIGRNGGGENGATAWLGASTAP